MADAPVKATLTTSGKILWSGGAPFDGALLLGLAPPLVGTSTPASFLLLDNDSPSVRIPTWYKIPVIEGTISNEARILNNASIEPPNSRYVAFWYDLTERRVGGPSVLFEIVGTQFDLTSYVPTLTEPTVTTVVPTPEGT